MGHVHGDILNVELAPGLYMSVDCVLLVYITWDGH